MGKDLAEVPFAEWVAWVFDRPITHPEWYFQTAVDGESDPWDDGDPRAVLAYLARLFEDPMPYLGGYHPRQLKQGLWYLASNACSNYMFAVLNAEAPWPERRRVLESFYTLYERLFEPLCAPDWLAHLASVLPDPLRDREMELHRALARVYDEHMPPPGVDLPQKEMGARVRAWDAARQDLVRQLEAVQASRVPWDPYPVNSACYMWWDILPFGANPDAPDTEFDGVVFDVLERTLGLRSAACREGALHGLGHWQHVYPERVKGIVDAWIEGARPEGALLSYAHAARAGRVQ